MDKTYRWATKFNLLATTVFSFYLAFLFSAVVQAAPTTDSIPPRPTASPLLGTNLIKNGDAEAGAASADTATLVPIPNWTTTGNFIVLNYDASGGFPAATDPGPINRGKNFFAGGDSNASSSATQTIDVSASASDIDSGKVRFDLSGYLGGYSSQEDNAVLTATFKSSANATLGTGTIGPVTAADRNSNTGLILKTTSGSVPVGTRSITLLLQMTRTDGAYNDGYADNLSLIFSLPTGTNLLPTTVRVATTLIAGTPPLTATGIAPSLGNSSTVTIQAGGVGGIPADATSIFGVLTNIGCTGGGNLRLWAGATVPNSINLNIPGANYTLNLSTSFTAALDNTGKVNLGLGSGAAISCGYAVDITGYIV